MYGTRLHSMRPKKPQTCSPRGLCAPRCAHRGEMVEVLSRRVLAWHCRRVSDLLPLVEAVVDGVRHGGAVLVLVHGAGGAQRPRQRLGVQPLSRSLRGAGGDAESLRAAPPARG